MKKLLLFSLITSSAFIALNTHGQTKACAVAQDANVRYGGRMEDRYLMDESQGLFGVFDGHGGQSSAQYIVDSAKYKGTPRITTLFNLFRAQGMNDGQALEHSIGVIESRLWQKCDEKNKYGYGTICNVGGMGSTHEPRNEHVILEKFGQSGSTALIAKRTGNIVTIANVGDSRAVLVRNGKIIHTTYDHKPNTPSEKRRIKNAGGTIFWHGCWRIEGFALSRMIGDINEKKRTGQQSEKDENPILSAIPEVYVWEIQQDDLLIMGTDGLWDAMDQKPNDNKVLQAIFNKETRWLERQPPINLFQDPTVIAEHLIKEAKKRSDDNITVLVVQL